jgi:hypothetical protein
MASFEPVLRIAQQQVAAAKRGDLELAVDQLAERGLLLLAASPATAADVDDIREILRLDRVLSGAIRERMIAISEEARDGQRGQRALEGYGHAPPPRSRAFDSVG